ncbi:MAG: bifunctional diaminohydroxyphosphoribosylaminopyrimidine deaminase/5-amino-6-(5-phosphoribosylamino)uracil reductase RibD [Campylobacteraceae bacterium]|nr:bifunctional diaminohydroxyphosphoribosylaminopyrimidine deaminase/5-amino-6-(5-phosphoribosylamino)uracil reductase RibD [Campylobacteraceae bacterium]
MVAHSDNALMQLALDEAWSFQGLTFPNPAVGAVISDVYGQEIAVAAHQKAGFPHAEVEVIKQAYIKLTGDTSIESIKNSAQIHTFLKENHQDIFHNLTLHVTLEPCNHYGKTPPCSHLIKELGFKKVVIGSSDLTQNAKGGGAFLQEHGIEVVFGVLKKECDELLSPFLTWQQNKPFIFFKIGLSHNGVAGEGIITSLASRKKVHELRNNCDLLVIGGSTVRIDRPILDSRLCHGKAPNVLIYSKRKDFDLTIPLFSVENRSVVIEKSLEKLNNFKCVMIEGGQNMLDAMSKSVAWYLIFRSPHFKGGQGIVLPSHLREVFSQKIGEDTMTWYKKDD